MRFAGRLVAFPAAARRAGGALVLALLAAACAAPPPLPGTGPQGQGLTSLEMTGRYGDLARAARQRAEASASPGTAVLAPLCTAYARLKDYGRLLPCLDRLEAAVRAGDTRIVTDRADVTDSDASPLANLLRAEALVELGDYRRAVTEATRAADLVQDRLAFGVWSPRTYRLRILAVRGLAFALAGDRDGAREQAREIAAMPGGILGWAVFPLMRDSALARIHMALGECAEALPRLADEGALVRSMVAVNDAAWGFTGPDTAGAQYLLPRRLMRARCLLETGEARGARGLLDAVLADPRIADFAELHWMAHFERGRASGRLGDPDAALEDFRRAADLVERQRSSVNTEANKIGFVADKQAVYARIVEALVARGEPGEALDYAERAKSRALVDLLAARRDFAVAGPQAGRARALVEAIDAAEARAAIQDDAPATAASQPLRQLAPLRDEVRQLAPELASLGTVTASTAQEVRARLAGDDTLVEYFGHADSLFAFVADRGQVRAVPLDGSGLEEDVRAFRRALASPHAPQWEALAAKLHARLWRPLAALVATPRVTIVAHGPLHYLPFAALRAQDGSLLVDRFAVRYLPSASVLRFLRPARPGAGAAPLLAFGDPDLGDPALALAFAGREAAAVAGAIPGSRLHLRASATETAFKDEAARFRRIHLATHGRFRAEAALQSGLYLARDAQNDGLLTVGELYSLRLDADLVTLSACETALGAISGGDDVVGLTRGFLYAGASAVVASLWGVDDAATAELMQAFYARLATADAREALRHAQLEARRTRPHPFHWAAFVLVGRER